MMKKSLLPLLIAAFCLLSAIAPNAALAAGTAEIRVSPNDLTCLQPTCFSTIQSAINYADTQLHTAGTITTGYTIRVESGTYNEAITLKSNIPVQGREAAKTVLIGTGSNAVITASGISSLRIENFTIQNAALGIDVSNSSSVIISNMIFDLGFAGTAVNIATSTGVNVINNTFFQNKIGINSNIDNIVTNNIFFQNTTAIQNNSAVAFNNVTYNTFDINGTIGSIASSLTNTTNVNPQFVDSVINDFHLLPGSPCINTGNPSITNKFSATGSDMSTYGGPDVDMIPFIVSGVAAVPSSTTITVSWLPNNSYLTKGYHVYYGKQSGVYNGTGAAEGTSPLLVTSGTSTTLSSLPVTTIAPSAPVLGPLEIFNESLGLSWSSVPAATSYQVIYSSSSQPTTTIDVGNTTSYRLSGLTNGQTYSVQVIAIAQNTFFMAITALDSSTGPYTPGISDESTYSTEVSASIGPSFASTPSNAQSGIPEMLQPYPNLPGGHQGCFIATAAYGNYSSPEVTVLREFRDRYLLTSVPGNAFVRWYYIHSPAAAAFLHAHPEYKPLVRAALTPAVGAALFMTRTSLPVKIILFMIMGCVTAFLVYRKRSPVSGGDH